jgi:polysaccharide biosynthesis/export protein
MMTMRAARSWRPLVLAIGVAGASCATVGAARQDHPVGFAARPGPARPAPITPAAVTPAAPREAYLIGPDDVLSIVFWKEKDLSGDVTVRPDGKVTLPLLNDIQAEGRTPDELRDAIKEAARTFVEDPNPTVIVKEIKSRRVFITGQVEKPGPYLLNGDTTVLQLIAIAGGLKEFADGRNITIMRKGRDGVTVHPFNYRDVLKRRNLEQNIELKPGDTVVVP